MNTIRFGFTLLGLAAATYGLVALLLLGRADAVAAAVVFVVALLGWWATHRSGTHRQAAELEVVLSRARQTPRREIAFSITVDPDRAPPWMKYHDEPYSGITGSSVVRPAHPEWTPTIIEGGKTRR